MLQPERMPELVDGLLYDALRKDGPVLRERIVTLAQSRQGDDRPLSAEFGLAKDEIEASGIEVHIRYPERSILPFQVYQAVNPAQDPGGVILTPRRIQGLFRHFYGLMPSNLALELLGQVRLQDVQDPSLNPADRQKDYSSFHGDFTSIPVLRMKKTAPEDDEKEPSVHFTRDA